MNHDSSNFPDEAELRQDLEYQFQRAEARCRDLDAMRAERDRALDAARRLRVIARALWACPGLITQATRDQLTDDLCETAWVDQ